MPNWLKNLINLLSRSQVQLPMTPVEEKSIEILPAFSTKTLFVNSEIGLNVRSGPDVNSKKIGTISYGAEATVLQEQSKWFEIKSGDLQGWVSSVYLTEEKPSEPTQRIVKDFELRNSQNPLKP